jgi:hypothetical protein
MKKVQLTLCCCMAVFCFSASHGQGILRQIKNATNNAANNAANKIIDKKTDEAIYGKDGKPVNGTQSNGKNNPSNKSGAGLITTPPNVDENLTSAETAFNNKNYGETRYSLQQAMLGVELQIGQNILKGLPETIAGLKKDAGEDQVASTSWGWTGLTIHREWSSGDKQLRFTIANNAVWLQAINLYLANGGYAQQTGGQQNWKQTKLKGYRAVIEYDQSSGYKLSVPLGQTSLLVYEGVNFATEQEMMDAAAQINIDAIKKSLGEK